MKSQKLLNLFGQIRIYSLIDLILFSIAIKANLLQTAWIVSLHLGFLLFLELSHKHSFRTPFPKYLWVILLITGISFYQHITVIGFLVSSFFYVKKNLTEFGRSGPIFRGLQYYFLASWIIGPLNRISFLVFVLLFFRNFAGDLRDIEKDQREGLRTLPIILWFKKDILYLHLLITLGTTSIWLYLSGIWMIWLIPIFAIQIGSYNLTPR